MQETQETWIRCLGREDPLEEEMATHSGKSHGQRSLVGYSPWGHKESDTTERLSPHTYTVNHRSAPLVEAMQDMGRALRPRVPAALLTPSHAFQKSNHSPPALLCLSFPSFKRQESSRP